MTSSNVLIPGTMDSTVSGDDGLIEDHVDLEDDSINFWATLGVNPHITEADNTISHHHGHIDHHVELVESSFRRELFESEETRLEPFVGMEFESGEAAKTFYIAYAGRVGFCVRIARSRRSKCNEDVIMLRFVCSREGFSREKRILEGKKTRKRAASIREGCKAMLEVIRKGDGKWIVTKLVKDHNHDVGMPSRVHYIATEGDAQLEPFLGMEFESLEIARTFYYAYASRVGFEARVRQSRRSLHDESLKMLKLVCSKHRYHSARENHDECKGMQSLEPMKEGCDALFEIIRKEGDKWVVSKLVLEHSHPLTPPPPSKVRCVRSQGEILVIAKNFADTRNLLLNGQESQYPREVRYNDLGPEDAQNFLEYLKKTQAENPAFYYAVQIEHNNFMTNIMWADAKARMAYSYFGDAVVLDTTYVNDKEMMPIVVFSGVNHHIQPIIFGCALLVDGSDASFIWLFENWLTAMGRHHPVSIITNLDMSPSIATAVSKVFPTTRHRFCKRHILKKFQEEFSSIHLTNTAFDGELKRCIDESETSETFKTYWETILDKYDLRDNCYMQFLYSIRQHWVPLYFRESFFAEISVSSKQEGLDKVIEKYFTAKTSLRVAVRQFSQAIANRCEKEAQADFDTIYNKPFLKTAAPMEKQAAGIYTRTVFDRFQEEFVQSLGYHVDRIEDGLISRYCVSRNEDGHETYVVSYSATETKARCSCCMFEFTGILCRHALRVFIINGVRTLPKIYILKRWTRNARSNMMSDEFGVELRANNDGSSEIRYEDLYRDAMRCAKEGATSPEFYRAAKEALQKAIAEIVTAKQKKGQQTLQNFIKSQKSKKFTKSFQRKDEEENGFKKKLSRMDSPSKDSN